MKTAKHISAIMALAIAATTLSACAKTETSSETIIDSEAVVQTDATTAPEESSAPEESTAPEDTSAPEEHDDLPITLLAPDGIAVKRSEVSLLTGEEGVTVDTMTADNWYMMECDGFGFAAEPTGLYFSSFDGSIDGAEIPETVANDYKRVKAGDKIGGFTVSSAKSSFAQSGFVGSEVYLEESAELTGWARLAPADDGYTLRGDVEFIPDSDSIILPVVNFSADENGKLFTRVWTRFSESESWVTEYPGFDIGNAYNGSTSADLSALSEDGTYTRVKLTLTNISLSCTIDFYSTIHADIDEIEAI